MDVPYTTLHPRKKPVRKVRAKARPGRLKGKAMGELRYNVYWRVRGQCELRISDKCEGFAGLDWGHMHHKIHRSLGGKDTLENCIWSCPPCHAEEHVPAKVVPPKQRIEENSWTPES
jgi:5-methylcytosine-specific restriction endonuclease McrA